MLGMTPSKQGHWEVVGKSKGGEDKKKRAAPAEVAANGKAKANGSGPGAYGNGVFADFDRSYAVQSAREKEQQRVAATAAAAAAAAAAPRYGGGFAHLSVEEAPAQRRPAGSSDGDDGSDHDDVKADASKQSARKAPKAKAPKKPRVTVSQVAASIDVGAVQEVIASLQQRYATNEASQVEVLADSMAKMFKEAQLDLPKALATKPLSQSVATPMDEVPPALANALASFCSSVSDAALAEVGVALLAALSEGFPLDANSPQQQQQQQQQQRKEQAGLYIMLATMLRTRPAALVLAAPQLLALGRALTASGRLPLLLWALSQAAAAEPAAAVAVWVRVVLPQCLGVPLPAAAPKSAAGGAAAQQVPRMDGASQEAAVVLLEGLLPRCRVAGSGGPIADLPLAGADRREPVVPGAAVEALARAAAPPAALEGGAPAAPAGGKAVKGAAGAQEAAEALAARLHAPLLALAGQARAQQQGEWLLLALETAGLSAASPDVPDTVTDRAAASVAACLASPSGEAAFAVWESKHKGQLRGSSRVLCTLARRPELLRPVLANRSRAEPLRRLLAALPARHKSFLAAGKGWQAAAARASEGAVATLKRRAAGGWGGAFGGGGAAKGGKGASSQGGAGGAVAAGVLAAAVATTGILVVAASYRREVAGVVQHYAGRPAAEALDASLLGPLNDALVPVRAALAPHVATAAEKLGPVADELQRRLEPALAHLEPFAAQAGEAWRHLVAQAQDIYHKAMQQ